VEEEVPEEVDGEPLQEEPAEVEAEPTSSSGPDRS
jgi:hypothetical protein